MSVWISLNFFSLWNSVFTIIYTLFAINIAFLSIFFALTIILWARLFAFTKCFNFLLFNYLSNIVLIFNIIIKIRSSFLIQFDFTFKDILQIFLLIIANIFIAPAIFLAKIPLSKALAIFLLAFCFNALYASFLLWILSFCKRFF